MTPPTPPPTSADDLALRGSALENAIVRLEAFGVSIAPSSRLRVALTTIRGVISAGTFPTDSPDVTSLVNAIEIAEDFAAIATHLPTFGGSETRRQLRVAVMGTLSAQESERAPFRYQSQHWIGTVLADARLNPAIPRDTARENPDYLIEYLTSRYGVEVKRPMYGRNVCESVEKAASQLKAYNVQGCVFVDVADCIREPGYQSARSGVEHLSSLIDDEIWDDDRQEHRAGYSHIIVGAAFARGTWIFRAEPTPIVTRENYLALKTYSRRRGTAAGHAAIGIKDAVMSAMRGGDMSVTIVSE